VIEFGLTHHAIAGMRGTHVREVALERRIDVEVAEQQEAALVSIERELGVAVPKPPGAFYAFVPVPFCDTAAFARELATEAAVLAIPGVAFGTAGEGFLRISYAASVDRIGTGIERIGRYLRTLKR